MVMTFLSAALLSAALPAAAPAALPAQACGTGPIEIGGIPLYVDRQGSGPLTVLMESGNGNDSHVWDELEPQIRAMGVVTLRYDRRGYGQSAPRKQARYRIEQDLMVAKQLLDRCSGAGPVLYVAHSFGGALATIGASRDRRIKGLVLIDAIAPGVETVASATAQRAQLRPQYDAVRKEAPALAVALLPVVEELPGIAATVNQVRLPRDLPITDIVADGGNADNPELARQWREGHRRFVVQAPGYRELIDVLGASHKVMADRPALVVAAIGEMIRRLSVR